MTVLELVQRKTQELDIDDMDRLIAIEEVTIAIKNYCNINAIPNELMYTQSNMVVELLRTEHPTEEDKVVSSIKIGDTQMDLKDKNYTVNSIVKNYKAQLNSYRRMTW